MPSYSFNPITREFNLVNDAIDLGSTFQGPYVDTTTYSIGQGVSNAGKLYICLAETTAHPPPNSLYWDELELQGPPGPQGDSGPAGPSPSSAEFIAAIPLDGHRMVTMNGSSQLIYADHTELSHAGRIMGLTMESSAAAASITISSSGLVTNPGWSWDLAKPAIFLATAGQISQTPPSSGFACVIGYAVSATQLFVRIQQPTILINP